MSPSGPVGGKTHGRRERRQAERNHHEAVEPERNARAIRQAVRERREQPPVQRIHRLAARPAQLQILLEPPLLFQRIEQYRALTQPGMFAPLVVSDFMFDKDRLFARLTLSDEEFRLYSQIHAQMAPHMPQPDLVIWLDGPTVALRERIHRRGRPMERRIESEYLHALGEAYGEYFDAHPALPVLMIDIDRFDPLRRPGDVQRLLDHIARFEGPREGWDSPPTITG